MQTYLRLTAQHRTRAWESLHLLRVGKQNHLEVVLEDRYISRLHAEIQCTEMGWLLEDRNSTNGTFLNGQRIELERPVLRTGDTVKFGSLVFQVELHPYTPARFRTGCPQHHGSLTVFPLCSEDQGAVDYLLSVEAFAAGVLRFEEAGRASVLRVENRGSAPVLLLEGEVLAGRDRDRVLDWSVLVPGHATLEVRVSCVGKGPWRRGGPERTPAGFVCPYHVRRSLKAAVSRSFRLEREPDGEQTIWPGLAIQQQQILGVSSATSSLADTRAAHQARLAEALRALVYVPGCTGIAVAIGRRLLSVDLFDKAATCARLWERILSGLLIDALLQPQVTAQPDADGVRILLHQIEAAAWQAVPTVGAGEDFRADLRGYLGSQLRFQGGLVHGTVVASGQ
jgi:hypothetical protein